MPRNQIIKPVQQRDLFGNTPVKLESSVPPKKPFTPLNLTILNGLDREACEKEAILYLRVLQKRFLARGQHKFMMKALYAEADIKSGKQPSPVILQNLFLETLLPRT